MQVVVVVVVSARGSGVVVAVRRKQGGLVFLYAIRYVRVINSTTSNNLICSVAERCNNAYLYLYNARARAQASARSLDRQAAAEENEFSKIMRQWRRRATLRPPPPRCATAVES